MESGSTIKHYKSRDDYMQRRGVDSLKKAVSDGPVKAKSAVSTDKVEISDKAKAKVKEGVDNLKDQVKADGKTLGKAATHLLGDAASAAVKALPSPLSAPLSAKLSLNSASKETAEASKAHAIQDKEGLFINRPAIIFISGLKLGSLSSDSAGLPELAQSIRGGEHFSWQDEDKILEEILKRPDEQPVMLVGHSLGGDAAVNIANKLNTLKGGFRNVDLLVTLDSVGFDNDIIPQNVKKNLNFISDEDYFFNDGPNIARNVKSTEVTNFLRSEQHREIDESDEVHFEIMTNIKSIMADFKQNRKYKKLGDLFKSFASK